MIQIKEISANQVLTLLFTSLGSDALVSFKDIDRFFDILIEVSKKKAKDSNHTLGINMPMNGNFDEKIFGEITEGDNKGKLKLIKSTSSKNEEIIKEKLTKHFISLVGNNKELINEYKTAMKLFNEEYNRNKLLDENIQEITRITFLEKVKGLVKCK